MPKTTKEGETDLNTSTGKYLFLFVPVTTFCLGYWQWRRHIWKTNLIEKIRSQINEEPIEFPINNLAQIEQMEYRKVHIDGTYMFQNQFIIRWRGRLDIEQNELNKSNLLSITNTSNGAQVITPFKISGTDLVIMINRGWIPPERIEFELNEGRKRQPIKKNIIGTIRGSEKPHWLLNNHPTQNIWVYKDLKQMANHCNASPILIDADNSVFNNESIEPIGNQTNIKLRNQHFNYMIQWFVYKIFLRIFEHFD
ncbi:SURF1-like protein [Meloidogyne graminicola]|uniref:SURF1-like protein n=1 Tax=Meloidogyne graminicola TaxID=189291 RepID=A0A8S9ZYW2_9BILA|nr:SURF1-like protein [Meloidogyne graminicola]